MSAWMGGENAGIGRERRYRLNGTNSRVVKAYDMMAW